MMTSCRWKPVAFAAGCCCEDAECPHSIRPALSVAARCLCFPLLNLDSCCFGIVSFNKCYSSLTSSGLLVILLLSLTWVIPGSCDSFELKRNWRWTNQWAVNIQGGSDIANQLASRHGYVNKEEILPNYYLFENRRIVKRSLRNARHVQYNLAREPQVRWLEQQRARRRVKRDLQRLTLVSDYLPNDPKWPEMWYLNRGYGYDMNVEEAWNEGITGKGAVVTILDDGLEYSHPDLKVNYDSQASFDINDGDSDPTPRYDATNENRHGTRCAGEIAAHYNNSFCVVGIAYNARIGGIRMLDGDVTDAVEARALAFNRDYVDIYSASWGPDDDGKTVDGPARLATLAFKNGIEKGRKGKGSIFVWASGNGGREFDSCNCDGYTNSIYTLSISSVTENGNIPWYSEACASTLATTYSSGSQVERMIVTTDLRQGCTETHTGTSASAPIAAAICALALEANPRLTWRDLQHIVVQGARPANLKAEDWVTNGVGRNVSHHYGYGLMDAAAMVRLARNWTTVPPQHKCSVVSATRYKAIPAKTKLQVSMETDGCLEDASSHVVYVEHVQAKITLTAPRRGDIQIFLTSPNGTRSTLLTKRPRDLSRNGFRDWAFMTSHCWGERAAGTWILEVQNDGWAAGDNDALLLKWELVLFGTEIPVGVYGGTGAASSAFRRSIALHSTGNYAASFVFCMNWLTIITWLLCITFLIP